VFHVHGLDTPDPDWGLHIGDCLHKARSALDHLMVRLVAFIRGEEPRDVSVVQFPIHSNPTRYEGAVSSLAKEPLLSGYLACVKEPQPFNNRNPSIWGYTNLGETAVWPLGGPPNFSPLPNAVDHLSKLDNVDKRATAPISVDASRRHSP